MTRIEAPALPANGHSPASATTAPVVDSTEIFRVAPVPSVLTGSLDLEPTDGPRAVPVGAIGRRYASTGSAKAESKVYQAPFSRPPV